MSDLVGQVFDRWTVIGLADDPRKVLCRCSCGTEKEVWISNLKKGASKSCGCIKRVYDKPSSMVGKTYGSWSVLGLTENPLKVHCRCVCGKERDVYADSILKGTSKSCGCQNTGMPDTTRAALRKHAEDNAAKYVGQTVNGFLVKDVHMQKSGAVETHFCTAVCPVCGQDTTVRLSVVVCGRIKMCRVCARDIAKIKPAASETIFVDKTNLFNIKNSCAGRVNKNSTTGVNGVSRSKGGTYRAYIVLRRKQFHLGSYPTLEEAAAARAAANEIFYKTILDENAGWEDRYREALSKIVRKPNKNK